MVNYSEKQKRKHGEFEDGYDLEPSQSILRQLGAVLAFCLNLLVISPLRWMWRQTIRLLTFTVNVSFALLRWMWRSTGRILSFTFTKTAQAAVWMVRTPFRFLRWSFNGLMLFIFGGPEPDDPLGAIRWRIKRRYRRRNRFITHLFAFAILMGYAWLDFNPGYYYIGEPLRSTPAAFTIFWAIVLLFHFVRLRMGDAEDRTIEAALERQLSWETPYVVEDEVVYEDRYTRLSDDGELIDYGAGLKEKAAEKRKRR